MTPAPGADLPLRDIHLPPAIGGWPPAPGWWLLAIATLGLLALLIRWWRRPRRPRPLKAARATLKRLDTEYQTHHDPDRLLPELSILLRRCALSLFPRDRVAGLTGDAWLDWLDAVGRLGPDEGFRHGPGRVLRDAQYRAGTGDVDGLALLALVDTWLQRVARQRTSTATDAATDSMKDSDTASGGAGRRRVGRDRPPTEAPRDA